MATATIENDDLAAWAEMPVADRDAYVRDIQENLDAKADASRAAPVEQDTADEPPPGKTRDEMGRYLPKTPASDDETPAARDAVPAAKPDHDDDAGDDWLTPEVTEQAAAYGLSPEDLGEFQSRAELDRALRIIDRKAFEAGKTAAKPADATPAAPAPASASQVADALATLESLTFDENELAATDAPKILDAFKTVAAELKELRQFRSSLQADRAKAAFESIKSEFANSVDSLGHTELFGKPGARTKEQQANLEKAFNEGHLPHARGLIAQGRQVAPTPTFAKAAVNLLFGDQIVNNAKQEQLSRLRKQSARRTGGGTTKIPPLPKNATPLEQNLREARENWRKAHGEDA